MYANPQYSVMVNCMISPKFTSSFVVKQGCCISPVLWNIFQNDIHDIFSQDECDPVRLYDIYINSISWADDLLILSHSRKGLQTCLDKLHACCSKWGLVVNHTQTKTMVFSKNKWLPEKFGVSVRGFKCTYDQSVVWGIWCVHVGDLHTEFHRTTAFAPPTLTMILSMGNEPLSDSWCQWSRLFALHLVMCSKRKSFIFRTKTYGAGLTTIPMTLDVSFSSLNSKLIFLASKWSFSNVSFSLRWAVSFSCVMPMVFNIRCKRRRWFQEIPV